MNIVTCAEVSLIGSIPTLEGIPSVLLNMISCFLDSPFLNLGSLTRRFKTVFSSDYSAKRIFQDRFDIPELVKIDVDDNERELKYIIASFSKFKSPDHLYQALRSEFLFGNKFNVLLPHLIKYFDRIQPDRPIEDDIEVLVKRGKFDLLLQIDPEKLEEHIDIIFDDYQSIRGLQEFFVANLEKFMNYRQFIQSSSHMLSWVKIALAAVIPDTLLLGYSLVVVDLSSSIWTTLHVPRHQYPDIFVRINTMIDKLSIESERDKEYYRLLNMIRFGPDIPSIYDEQIQNKLYSKEKMFLLCYCASLANKKDLFIDLFFKEEISTDKNNNIKIPKCLIIKRNVPIEMHKFVFDILELSLMYPGLRQAVRDKANVFLKVLSKYCRVSGIKFNGGSVEIEFKAPSHASELGIPERVSIDLNIDLSDIPLKMKFDNAEVFEDCLLLLPKVSFSINGENLKLITKSERLRQFIRSRFEYHSIIIGFNELLKVIDEDVPPLADILSVCSVKKFELSVFRTVEQLQRLEIITGCLVSRFMIGQFNYFQYRHIFRYMIESGQDLPKMLPETLALLRIDYPQMMI